MKKLALLVSFVACTLALRAGADPVPGLNKVTSPLTKHGTTVGIQVSTTGQAGSMSSAQAQTLASLAAASPTAFPPLTFPDGIVIREVGAATVLVADAFTGANTANFNGRTTTSGSKTWTTPSAAGGQVGHWGISSNKATPANNSETNAVLDTGAVDGTIRVVVSSKGTGVTNQGAMFRCTAAGDCLWFGFYNAACWGIGHGVAVGNGTVYTGDGCVTPLTNGDVLSVTYSGNSISATLNGSAFLSTTQTQNNSSTYAGMSAGGGTVFPLFDDFSVSTVAVPVALVIDVPLLGGGVQIPSQLVLGSSLSVAGASALHAVTATTETLSGQLTNTSAIGTPPFVLTSTTKSNNLNADLLDGLDSTAFASSTTPHYFTMVSQRNVTNTSANSSPITLGAAVTPAACTAEVQAVGIGAGTCTYALYDSTASAALCTVSLACNSSSGTTGTCASSGSAASGHTLVLQETAPAANTSSAFVVLTCSY